MRFFKISAAILLAATLAGCAEPDRFHHGALAEDYQYGEFDYAASRRDIRLSTIGYPFADTGTKAAFPRIVETWMWGRNQGPKTNFTGNPGPSHRIPYNVIMVFNADHAMSPRELCRATPENIQTMPAGEDAMVSVQAAFCRGDKPLSVSSTMKTGITTPLGKDFGLLISDTAYILFPRPANRCGPNGSGSGEPDFGHLNN